MNTLDQEIEQLAKEQALLRWEQRVCEAIVAPVIPNVRSGFTRLGFISFKDMERQRQLAMQQANPYPQHPADMLRNSLGNFI